MSYMESPEITKLRDECNHWRDQWHLERKHRQQLQQSLEGSPFPSDLYYASERGDALGRVLRRVLGLKSSHDNALLVSIVQARTMMEDACEKWDVPELIPDEEILRG